LLEACSWCDNEHLREVVIERILHQPGNILGFRANILCCRPNQQNTGPSPSLMLDSLLQQLYKTGTFTCSLYVTVILNLHNNIADWSVFGSLKIFRWRRTLANWSLVRRA